MASKAQMLDLKGIYALVRDLHRPVAWIYWLDLAISAALGWAALAATALCRLGLPARLGLWILAVFALYRAACFLHEVAHLHARALPGFRLAWTLGVGIPLHAPPFTYLRVHRVHHRQDGFGTHVDAEYLDLERPGAAGRATGFLLLSVLLPVLAVPRFLLLAPLTLLHPRLRKWVDARFSAQGIRPGVLRAKLALHERRAARWEEAGCCAFDTGLLLLWLLNALPTAVPVVLWSAMAAISLLNAIRALLGTHRYALPGLSVNWSEQLADSVNLTGSSLLLPLLAPVGLRYHALHHLLPGLPYHALGRAHQRLSVALPAEHPYHAANCSGMGAQASRLLWRWWRRGVTSVPLPQRQAEFSSASD